MVALLIDQDGRGRQELRAWRPGFDDGKIQVWQLQVVDTRIRSGQPPLEDIRHPIGDPREVLAPPVRQPGGKPRQLSHHQHRAAVQVLARGVASPVEQHPRLAKHLAIGFVHNL